jgi:hypothetical protein
MAVYSLDPWGEERADLRSGIIAATMVNLQRDPRKGKPVSPDAFMPKFGGAPEMAPPAAVKDSLLAAFGHMMKKPKPKKEGGADER